MCFHTIRLKNADTIRLTSVSTPRVDPLLSLVVDTRVVAEHHRQGSTPVKLVVKKKSEVNEKSCFKSAENRPASSLWVGGHRYTRVSCVSKLLWEYNVLEVRQIIRPYQNLRKSLLILISLKKYLKFTISNYSKFA